MDSADGFYYFIAMKLTHLFPLGAVLSFVVAAVPSAHASAPPELLGRFGVWGAYKMIESGSPVCYMSLTTRPPQDKKQKTKRGDVVLMIAHRPKDHSTDVVSYTAGVRLKAGSEATITTGGKTFNLFTHGDTAWSRDVATDHALAAAIRRSSTLTVKGQTARDTVLSDTLNLKGSFEAYTAINKACGLPTPEPPKAANVPTKAKPAPAVKKTTPKKTP